MEFVRHFNVQDVPFEISNPDIVSGSLVSAAQLGSAEAWNMLMPRPPKTPIRIAFLPTAPPDLDLPIDTAGFLDRSINPPYIGLVMDTIKRVRPERWGQNVGKHSAHETTHLAQVARGENPRDGRELLREGTYTNNLHEREAREIASIVEITLYRAPEQYNDRRTPQRYLRTYGDMF